jgi:hypothetical protein
MRAFFALLLVALPASAQQPTWFLLSREGGCVDLKALVDLGAASRVPVSPEDYAQMMRERGKKVTLGPPPDVPSELNGKMVQATTGGEDGGPVFARDEVCRKIRR